MRISDWSSDVCSSDLAIEPRGRPFARLLDRMRRKLDRDPACITDAFAHPVRQHQMMPVAWHQIAPRLRDPDDRPVALQLLQAQPVIEIALDIQRRHRSEERRGGKEWVSPFRSRWSPFN